MSTTNFYTPGFVRMVNVRLGETLSPLVTGQLAPGGQIQAPDAQQRREIVLDRERERSHYFDGKLLKASDLLRDQNYLDARLRQAGRAFGAGIVQGLDAALEDGWVSVQPGVAISPSGRVLELKDHVLRAPVDDAALRAALNQGRHGYLSSGLYVLLLSWHEQTSDAIAEVYPRQAGERPAPQPDAYEEGVRLELMASPEPLPLEDPLDARAALAERYLASGVELPGMPAESIALGLLAVRDNRPLWLDGPLVRRDYRRERVPHAARLRLAEHHGELLADLVAERHRDEAFELSRYFGRIPAFGRLPNAMLDVRNQAVSGFPDHYELELVPVRARDIGFVREQAEHLPPLDLTAPKVERVQILVPLEDAAYEALAVAIDAETGADTTASPGSDTFSQPLMIDTGTLPTALIGTELAHSPFDRLRLSSIDLTYSGLVRMVALSAWELAFESVSGDLGLYYVREFQLAAIQAPQVLPISAGFPPAVIPDQPEPDPDPEPEPEPGIADIIVARGVLHPEARAAIEKLIPVAKDNESNFRALLGRLDNAYDRFFWITLASSGDPAQLVLAMLKEFDNGLMPADMIRLHSREFDLDPELVDRWSRLAEVLGDIGDIR